MENASGKEDIDLRGLHDSREEDDEVPCWKGDTSGEGRGEKREKRENIVLW